MGLEVLMAVDHAVKRKEESFDFRLQLMDRDPDRVRLWFPELFPTVKKEIGTDVEAEEYITHDLSGESSEFVSGESAQISPEEVEAILRQLSSGSGGMGDLDSSWE